MQAAEVERYSKDISKELLANALDELRLHGYDALSSVDNRRKIYRASKGDDRILIQIRARSISGTQAEICLIEDDKLQELRDMLRPDELPLYAYAVRTKKGDVLFCAFPPDDVLALGERTKSGIITLKHKKLETRALAAQAEGRQVIFSKLADGDGDGGRVAVAAPKPVYRTPQERVNQLDAPGRELLAVLVKALDDIIPGAPETYISYGKCHDELLGLEKIRDTHGASLSDQGMASLADWLLEMDIPAITGILISLATMQPGGGYYKVYGKSPDKDFVWWREEVERAKAFDWQPYMRCIIAGDAPCDYDAPEREDIVVSRFIRESALSRTVKKQNDYRCQICGETVHLANGEKYAEAHHIQPLGAPHNGEDTIGNMICVCPNHHAQLDFGAIKLDKKALKRGFCVEEKFVDYHNEKIYKK